MRWRRRPIGTLRNQEFLETPEGKLARYYARKRTRLHLNIHDVEPGSKTGMPLDSKNALQKQVLDQLDLLSRRAYQGPLVLQLDFHTTGKTPSHAHTISKNVLDLLSKPGDSIQTGRKNLLYKDDSQIHALSVSCQHGTTSPKIRITANSLRNLIEDAQFAMRAEHDLSQFDMKYSQRDSDSIESLKEAIQMKERFISRFGEANYNAWLNMLRMQAQEQLFGNTRIRPVDIGFLYSASDYAFNRKNRFTESMHRTWEDMFQSAPLRILLSELPQKDGSSTLYLALVKEKIREFKDRYGWILAPLRIPLALEVFIKPSPPEQTRGLHDLDNVLREYLIPRIVEEFEPPSHYLFAASNSGKESSPWLTESMKDDLKRLPASTRIGLTRFEAWRLPRAQSDTTPGFVSMAVVSDQIGFNSVLWEIDKIIDDWGHMHRTRN